MGQSMSWLSGLVWSKKEIRILILGLVWSVNVQEVLSIADNPNYRTTPAKLHYCTDSRSALASFPVPRHDQTADNAQIGEVVTTIPTIGFNVESVTYKNLNFNVWVCGPLLNNSMVLLGCWH